MKLIAMLALAATLSAATPYDGNGAQEGFYHPRRPDNHKPAHMCVFMEKCANGFLTCEGCNNPYYSHVPIKFHWYTSKKFWIPVGIAVGAGLSGYLSTRGGSQRIAPLTVQPIQQPGQLAPVWDGTVTFTGFPSVGHK